MRTRTKVPLAVLVVAALAGCEHEPIAPWAPEALGARVGVHGTGAPGSIAFHSDRDGNREVYVMNPNGSGVRRVTDRPATPDFYPDIFSNGEWIVFTSAGETGLGDIYLVSSSGGPAVNLTNTPLADDDWARWSPDGQQIVFHSDRDGGDYEIYVMNMATREVRRVTERTGEDMWPDWSPTGGQIVYRRDLDIVVQDLRDGSTQQLTGEGFNQMASWSQNGQRIAFMSFRLGYCAVFVMNADGSDQENLTPTGTGACSRAPSWTRDGRILFMSTRTGTLGSAIFVMDADGGNLQLLTDAPGEDGGPSAR